MKLIHAPLRPRTSRSTPRAAGAHRHAGGRSPSRLNRLLTLLLAAVGIAAMPACSDKPDAELVFISSAAHKFLDPQKLSWMHDARIVTQLYEPLVRVDFTSFDVEPAAAESWTLSDDGRTYTFTLRDDLRWSNGDAVTAGDFVAAWRRALLPDSAADYTKLLLPIAGAEAFFDQRAEQLAQFEQIRGAAGGAATDTARDAAETMLELALQRFDESVGIDAPDDRTLVVTLHEPVPYFIATLSMPVFFPVHAASLEAASIVDPASGLIQTDAGYFTDPERLMTNGPYRLAGRSVRQWLHMEANPHYWNADAVGPKSIREDILTDPLAAEQAFTRGQADWVVSVPSAHRVALQLIAARDEGRRDDVFVSPLAGTYFYTFNCMPTLPGEDTPNPLADARVRRALAMAIDREMIVNRITQAGQSPATTFIPPTAFADYQPPAEHGVAFDPEAAAALLAEAGHPAGKGLEGLSLLMNTGAGHETIGQFVAEQWREHLGVSVPIEAVEVTDFADRLDNQQFSIARAAWIGDYPDPTTFLNKMSSKSENNDSKYQSEAYDNLLAKAAAEDDPAARLAMLRQAEAQLLKDQPMAFVYHYVNIDLAKPWLADIERNDWGRWRMWEFPAKPE